MKRSRQPQLDSKKMFYELLGVVLFLIATYLFLCIASYNPRDDSILQIGFDNETRRNIVGYYGNQVSAVLFALFGISSYSLPLILLFLSYRLFFIKSISFWLHKILCSFIAIIALASLTHSLVLVGYNSEGIIGYAKEDILAGGIIGRQFSSLIMHYIGTAGTLFALIALLAGSLFVVLGGFSISNIFKTSGHLIKKAYSFICHSILWVWKTVKMPFIAVIYLIKSIYRSYREFKAKHSDVSLLEEELKEELEETERGDLDDPFHIAGDQAKFSRKNKKPIKQKKKDSTYKSAFNDDIENLKVPKPDINIIYPKQKEIITDKDFSKRMGYENTFLLPLLSFMKDYPSIDREQNRDIYNKQSRELEKKLLEHNIAGRVIDVKPGPVITRYDFRIAPSIKIKSIKNLEEDISLALGVNTIRIMSVPENRSLGFEIPNHNKLREVIGLKDIIKSADFTGRYRIPIALGKDIAGYPVVTDLAHMPHLLIGGATGSGKSVCLNSLLISLLYRFTPDELQVILIDPKQIEFGLYEDLPHLIAPVITDPDKALNVLKWAVNKMEECYNDIAAQRVRNIQEYNSEIRQMRNKGIALEEIPQLMPYRVIVIDEFGDLMMTSKGNDLDECVLRLAQKARAVGIHLVMATQRPSVDVITGLIKANLRARIAFRVTQGTDSKTILDRVGAERLLGMGDMFYRPPDNDVLQRVHGAFISTNEIKRIVEFLKEQRKPDYDEGVLAAEDEGADLIDEIMEKEEDPLYPSAVDLVVRNQMASVSMLQRRLKIGHARASRMIDMMAYDNVVGPFVGSKMREVYLDENSLRQWVNFGQSREKLREITSGYQN